MGSGQTFGFAQQMEYIKKLGLKVQRIIKKNFQGLDVKELNFKELNLLQNKSVINIMSPFLMPE